MKVIGRKRLMTAKSVAKNGDEYSSSMDFSRCTGEVCVLIRSTAGSITVTQQCSVDGDAWFDPKDSDGSAAGAVGTTMTSITGGKYITYTPVMAPYIRFKVDETDVAAASVTLDILFQEEV